MFSGPEQDRLLIRELIDSYSDAVMLGDAEAWGSTWAEDGRWVIRGREIAGRDAIVGAWRSAMASFRAVMFHAFPGSIQVDGDQATLRTHTFEHLEPTEGPIRLQAGLYSDRLVKRKGRWMFAERSFEPRDLKL